MEFSPRSSSEFGSGSPENKDSADKDSSKDKKKKSATPATRLAGIATETSLGKVEPKAESPVPAASGFEGWLQRLRGSEPKPKEKEAEKAAPFLGIPKPESEPAKIEKPAGEETGQHTAEEADTEAELSEEERQEERHAIQDFIEIRLEAVDNEVHEMPLEDLDSSKVAEVAAQTGYLRELQDQAAEENDLPIGEVIDEAERVVRERIEQPVEDYAEVESGADAEDVESEAPEAMAGSGGGGERPPEPPDFPPTPPGGDLPPEPHDMPRSPLWPDHQPQPIEAFDPHTTAMAPAPEVAPVQPRGNERAALGQGLLIGGIAGYFIGRHRGRKQGAAAAERKNVPVRKSLERRIRSMQESITGKENQLKSLAHEKMEALQSRKDRERFVAHVSQTAVERPEAVHNAPAIAPVAAGEVYARSNEKTGRVIGEIPLAAVAGVASVPAGIEALQREHAPENPKPAEVVPFNKKAEEFSREELMTAAAKIKVEGTTLKEITELGRVDEMALRRVVGEFLRGGDVSKAVSHEIKEKELRYEQDPRLRQQQDGKQGQAASGALGAGGLIVGGLLGGRSDDSHDSKQIDASGNAPLPPDRRPQLDPDTLRAIRNKQIAAVTTTVLVVVAVIAIAFILT